MKKMEVSGICMSVLAAWHQLEVTAGPVLQTPSYVATLLGAQTKIVNTAGVAMETTRRVSGCYEGVQA